MMPSVVPIMPANKNRGQADDHRHPRAEDQPRQHVAPELIGAEQVLVGAARHPERRFEARRQHPDLGIMRRQILGENRDERDRAEDQHRQERKIAEPEAAQRGETRRARWKACDIG